MKLSVVQSGLIVRRLACLSKYYKRSVSLYLWKPEHDSFEFPKLTQNFKSLKVKKISFGHGFAIASTTQQRLLVSGVNENSQLGIPSEQLSYVSDFTEVKLQLLNKHSKILDLSCGRLHTTVLTSEGLFVAGSNTLGQCGLGNLKECKYFTKIPWSNETTLKQVVCGLDHTLLLTNGGNVWSCGWGADGQTGLGHTEEQRTFTQMELLENVQIKKLASKADTSLALPNCNRVFAWGNSEYGQVGFATDETLISKPTKIPGLENVVDIAIGGSAALAVTDLGEVFSWGYGLLGNHSEASFATPQKLSSIREKAISVHCGLDFYIVLTGNQSIYIWGRIGNNETITTPRKIRLPLDIFSTSCGIEQIAFIG